MDQGPSLDFNFHFSPNLAHIPELPFFQLITKWFFQKNVFLTEDYDFQVFIGLLSFFRPVTSNKESTKGKISFCPIYSQKVCFCPKINSFESLSGYQVSFYLLLRIRGQIRGEGATQFMPIFSDPPGFWESALEKFGKKLLK